MRSRYSAFVMCNERYLLESWHPRTRPKHIEFDPQQKWLGLTVRDVRTISDIAGEVEFIAKFRIGGGSAARLHERSTFERLEGRWLYVDGTLIHSK